MFQNEVQRFYRVIEYRKTKLVLYINYILKILLYRYTWWWYDYKSANAERMNNNIETTTGIRQGDSLSPVLFNLILNKLINSVKSMNGYQMGNRNLTIVYEAEDADSEVNLQRLLLRVPQSPKRTIWQLQQKTRSMVISKEPVRCKLQIIDRITEQVMTFEYLGMEISNERNQWRC